MERIERMNLGWRPDTSTELEKLERHQMREETIRLMADMDNADMRRLRAEARKIRAERN